MTQILGHEKQGLVFEIVSARISEESNQKKYVIYTLQVRHLSGKDDLSPSVIERRYTHFLMLYNALRKEQPTLMSNIVFPKKVILGNFHNELISMRSTGFEALLTHITTESKLRSSRALLDFLQNTELQKVKVLLDNKQFADALPLLESSFRLLNKVFTDRSPGVLIALCRLIVCCMVVPECADLLKWADLALHRYEGVSDSDLLELYVPLINICIQIWTRSGRTKDVLEGRLLDLKRQGIKVSEECSFLDKVNLVEEKIFGS